MNIISVFWQWENFLFSVSLTAEPWWE